MHPVQTPLPPGFSIIQCDSLTNILEGVGRTHVDLFVLDVEGAEMIVLDSIDFNKLTFGAWMIESTHHFSPMVDYCE
jgi:hypothetical protein